MFRRRTLLTAAVAVPTALATSSALTGTASADGSRAFPTEFPLPNGFLPEGIAIGPGPFAYFGSRADGRIHRVNLVTGVGRDVSAGPGTPSVGLKTDERRIYVSGGPAGNARLIDLRSGTILATYTFSVAPTFINDVVLTPAVAWFTDSNNPFLFGVPRRRHGVPGQADVIRLPLSGDYVHVAGFNANGIARTPDGRALLIVQSATGLLFRVDPRTGVARTVDLAGELLTNGDGLLVDGRTLFVVQNQLNRVSVFRLDRTGSSGRLQERLTDPRFDIPTTVAAFGNRLYLPNARFSTPPTPTTPYNAVAINR
ncbi:superoxide dismutase [Actinophytocola sp.]|uniref:SMP-30/gluconolactonase/LRE family protein n=1 Tax=Actinophytocola sp. TaxID=1872138 RepID=UPI002D7F023C|nr:superoxide dismutase [Actinophytocola sp.]HET9138731.1 superoxide dismutase [Actinophytocola sp.]